MIEVRNIGLLSGDHDWTRTNDPYHVKVVLYQLSHAITFERMLALGSLWQRAQSASVFEKGIIRYKNFTTL